jgi:hypothetical protein
MKKLLILLLTLMVTFITVNAQTTAAQPVEQILVNATDLTPAQLQKIKTDAELSDLKKKVETYGNWVGVGKEVGIAIKEGLLAVVDVSEKFGNTKVGTFTMVMVAYKIIGRDMIRIAIGILFLLVFIPFLWRYYRTTFMTHRVKQSDNGWKFWLPNKYTLVEPDTYDGYEFVKFLTVVALAGGFGIAYMIMFA